jgi:hypothetical protein
VADSVSAASKPTVAVSELKRSTTLVIAEPPSHVATADVERTVFAEGIPVRTPERLSLGRVAARLHLVLATRRAAHSDEHAYWYTVVRGM